MYQLFEKTVRKFLILGEIYKHKIKHITINKMINTFSLHKKYENPMIKICQNQLLSR